MISRRGLVAGGCALAAAPLRVRADPRPLILTGPMEQGSLVVGFARPCALTVDGARLRVSEHGIFAFGFAYDQTAPSLIEARYAGGASERREAQPRPRQYETQSVNGLPERFVAPSPEELARIEAENARVFEARKRDTPGVGFAEPFDWPIPGIVSSLYGSRRIDNGKPMAPHLGVDIAAPENTPIRAPADGVVSLAEPDFFLTGGTTLIDHGHGVSTAYVHQNELRVKPGDAVRRGDVIGLVGMKGRATGPHLHWGLNWFQSRLDPSRSTTTPAPARA
ncbi:MAG TPA: M23 family metallopeptidase [Rhizomicrobium sp.]|nr:M23 family metallopeptidase [Rhizomicrobium sp.]